VATPRYIDEPVQLPEPVTIEQANKNIAYISNLKAQGIIDLDFANSLIADQTTIANNLIAEEELKFKINPPERRDSRIVIQGGYPRCLERESICQSSMGTPCKNNSSLRRRMSCLRRMNHNRIHVRPRPKVLTLCRSTTSSHRQKPMEVAHNAPKTGAKSANSLCV
jgi:hypothetical protein